MTGESMTSKDDQLDRRLYGVFLINLCFAGLTLTGWAMLYPIVAGPLRWGTGQPVASHPEPLDYPYCILWVLPLAAVGLAWLLRSEGQRSWAIVVAAAPLVFLTILVACYYLGPGIFG